MSEGVVEIQQTRCPKVVDKCAERHYNRVSLVDIGFTNK
jgi:hypothetical protein